MPNAWCWIAMSGALAVASPALAGEGGSGWTNGGMFGSGEQGFYATAGFPGLSAGYLRGLDDSFDLGGRFSFNYGGEGATQLSAPGLKLAADVRLRLGAGLPYALTLRVLPGIDLYFPPRFTVIDLALPVELALAIPVMPNLLVHPSLQVPFAIGFWSGFGFSFMSLQLPFLFGGGVELRLDRTLSVHGQLHLGPYVSTIFGNAPTTDVAFDASLGLTYRLP